MSIPLWLSIPAVSGMWLSCWISLLDPTGSGHDNYLLWGATAIASGFVAMRLMRPRRQRA
jgi:hypothetical protein